MLPNKILLCM
ncbi:hypothetical protein Pcinc_006674 [Petrolisthes cinctipes]|uniref:Uncharacterized protein n=1 Tax=Petrolisthes cinctipes TaxID=88211 RepID=A0AAE1GCQ2_PETCI|nr:hypothetical protein Pcinc_006674 [Petrolisthes cinctipes]